MGIPRLTVPQDRRHHEAGKQPDGAALDDLTPRFTPLTVSRQFESVNDQVELRLKRCGDNQCFPAMRGASHVAYASGIASTQSGVTTWRYPTGPQAVVFGNARPLGSAVVRETSYGKSQCSESPGVHRR